MEQLPRRTARRWVAAATAAAALGPLAACGSHDAAAPPSSTPSVVPHTTTRPAVAHTPPMKVSYRSITGRFPKADRRHLASQLTAIVERWWANAYLSDRSKSFPVFTPAAAKLAEKRAGLTTSAPPRGATISVVRRTLAIDALAVKKKPVGVDAVTELTYTVANAGQGSKPTRFRVAGTISLTPTRKGWRVFAFDLTKEKVGATPHRATTKHATKHAAKHRAKHPATHGTKHPARSKRSGRTTTHGGAR